MQKATSIMKVTAILLLAALSGLFVSELTAQTIHYVPAAFDNLSAVSPDVPGTVTAGNTSAWPPGGKAFTGTNSTADNIWALRAFGPGYVAQASSNENPPALQTRIAGLSSGRLYRIYLFFLDLNQNAGGSSNCWIQAGLTMDALRNFFADYTARFRESGYSWTGDLPPDGTNGSSCAVFVGAARPSQNGDIFVYALNQTSSANWRTDYLGVGYEEVPTEEPPYPTSMAFHVSPQGSDDAAGTELEPWRTLGGARDRLRSLRAGKFDPSIIWVHEGTYPLEQSLLFDERDSWTIYRAVSNASVRVIGGVERNTNLTRVTDPLVLGRLLTPDASNHLYQLDLPAVGITNYGEILQRGFVWPTLPQQVEVYVNGHRLFMGQYPNPDQKGLPIGEVLDPGSWSTGRGGVFRFSSSRVACWSGASNVWIKGFLGAGWADDLLPVAAIDLVAMTLATSIPDPYGFQPWSAGADYRRFFGVNLFEEIDVPGESWLDRASGRLYLYPPDGTDPAAVQVGITTLEGPLISISNACHVVFDGMDLGLSRGVGLQIYGGDHCGIRNAGVSELGNQAVMIESDSDRYLQVFGSGHDHYVASCRIHDCGSGGIGLGGGLTAEFNPGRNRVENCEIYDVNRHEQTYHSAVNFDGFGHLVRNSLIHNLPQIGVLAFGSMHRIEYNELAKVFFNAGSDSGAIYQGRTPIGWNEICNNLFYDVANASPYAQYSYGVYLDDGYYGARVQRNVFVRSGKSQSIRIGGGSLNQCTDNIFLDGPTPFMMDSRLTGGASSWIQPGGLFDQLLNSVDYQNPPWSLRRPELTNFWNETPATPFNTLARNLCVRSSVSSITTNWWTGTPDTRLDLPGFVQGLRLLSNSAACLQITNFHPGDVAEMGVRLSLTELRMRDWNTALRKTGYLGALDSDLSQQQLLTVVADPTLGARFLSAFLFPGKDPDGLAPTPSGFALRLSPLAGGTNSLNIRVNADAVPLVGMRLEESDDLKNWEASSLLLHKQWSDNLDGFEGFESAPMDIHGPPRLFYRVAFVPLW